MAGTIQGTFGWDNSPLIAGMAQAETIATRGAAHVQNKFLDIFKRSPNMRAERAFSGLAQSLASGDIAGGIESITHRMTGLGVIAGVAIGAGVAIFMKFREEILATRDAQSALQAEMRKPLSITTSLSNEGMEQALKTRQKLADDLLEKSQHRFGSELSEAFQSMIAGPTFGAIGGKDTGKERLSVDEDLNKNAAERKIIMQAQADLAQKMVNLKKEEAFGDEHSARVGKILLETEQMRAELKGKGLTASAFRTADKAAEEAGGVALALEDKRVETKNRALEVEEKIAKLIRGGLSAEDQRKVRAGLELQMINKQVGAETDPERRRALLLQKAQKENEVRSFGNPAMQGRNPFAFGTQAASQFESEQGGFGTIAQRSKETQDSGSFGSLAQSAALRGETALAKPQNMDQEIVKALRQLVEIEQKAWLTP